MTESAEFVTQITRIIAAATGASGADVVPKDIDTASPLAEILA